MLAALLAASVGAFTVRLRFLVALMRAAAPVTRSGDPGVRARNEGTIVLGQRKLLQRLGPGLIHAFIFWGFLVLLPTIVIAMIGAVDKHDTFPWLGDQGWYAL
ncbi:MAG: Fe-S oxidoreductase, partial [Solirubrobacteraceae bacterium]